MGWGMAIGGALAYLGSQNAADGQRDAANTAANAGKFTPYNVYSGFGSGSFSPATQGSAGYWSGGSPQSGGWDRGGPGVSGMRNAGAVWNPGTPGSPASATASLNPQYQHLRDQFMQNANGNLGAFSNYDPNAASADIYGKLSALSAPNEALARSDQESRLFAQGRLGSTGGGIEQKALFDSQGQSRIARELHSYTTAQDTLNQLQSRAINSTNAASGLDSLALQNLNLGGAFGGRAMQGNQFGAGIQYNAAQRGADSTAAFWSGIGQQVGPAINSYMSGYNNNGFNSQYSNNYGNNGPNAYSNGGGFGQGASSGAFNYSV